MQPDWFGSFPDILAEEVYTIPPEVFGQHERAKGFAASANKTALQIIQTSPVLLRDPIFKIIDDLMSSIARWADDEDGRQRLLAQLRIQAHHVFIDVFPNAQAACRRFRNSSSIAE